MKNGRHYGVQHKPAARASVYAARSEVWRELGIVVKEPRIIYSSIPRAANTSVKLAISAALGVDPSRYLHSHWPHASQAAGVHNAALAPWASITDFDSKHIPSSALFRSRNWLWFATVRHPLPRLFSSWSLFLLQKEPHLEALGIEVEYPPFPRKLSEIPALFSDFIFGSDIHELMKRDVHFAPQVDLLPCAATEGRQIYLYRTERLSELENDVRRHFRRQRFAGSFSLGRENEGAIGINDFVWSEDVYSRCQELYESDYAAFGYERHPEVRGAPRATEDLAANLLRQVRERHARIGALAAAIANLSTRP